jgi:hypothetical protein
MSYQIADYLRLLDWQSIGIQARKLSVMRAAHAAPTQAGTLSGGSGRAMLETCGSAGKGVSVKEGVPSRVAES